MLTEPFDSAASEEGKVLQVFHTGISIPSTVNYMSHVIGCFFLLLPSFWWWCFVAHSMSSTSLCLGATSYVAVQRGLIPCCTG